MTERETVAGLLRGELGLADVQRWAPRSFDDARLGVLFAAATTWLELNVVPTPKRVRELVREARLTESCCALDVEALVAELVSGAA